MLAFDLIRLARQRLDDTGGDTADPDLWASDDSGLLWKNTELVTYLNEAVEKVAHVFPIRDYTTPEITRITVQAGTDSYAYDPRILFIDGLNLSGVGTLQRVYERDILENRVPEDGPPQAYMLDYEAGRLWILPTPLLGGTLTLQVRRMPLRPMDWNRARIQEPEINPRYHLDLIDWVCYRALSKNDADVQNLPAAEFHHKRFQRYIGEAPSARMERAMAEVADGPLRTRAYP